MKMKQKKMIRTEISPRVSEAEAVAGKSVVLYLFLSLWLCVGSEAGGGKVSSEH